MKTKPEDFYSGEEAERRFKDLVHRALNTPHTSQKEMVGKVGRPSGRKSKAIKDRQQKA
jgi:hypothetical protein